MRGSYLFVYLAAVSLALTGCGGDKKVEERVAQIQTNAPIEQNVSSTPEAPKTTDVKTSQSSLEGKQLYDAKCAACHGEKGEGKASYPKLAGNNKEETLKKLKGYIDGSYGKAQKMLMTGQAKNLSDSQQETVGEYIGSLK